MTNVSNPQKYHFTKDQKADIKSLFEKLYKAYGFNQKQLNRLKQLYRSHNLNQKEKTELRDIIKKGLTKAPLGPKQIKEVENIVGVRISEVVLPFIDIEEERWDELRSWRKQTDRKMNALISNVHQLSEEKSAFWDRSSQHDDRLTNHEHRITKLENTWTTRGSSTT